MKADLRALADFLEGLEELTANTGVKLAHYERVRIELPSGQLLHLAGAPEDGEYRVDIRDNE